MSGTNHPGEAELLEFAEAKLAGAPPDGEVAAHVESCANCYRHAAAMQWTLDATKQAGLVEQIASVHHNVMVVGDDAQSIYRFRGADYANLFEFEKNLFEPNFIGLMRDDKKQFVVVWGGGLRVLQGEELRNMQVIAIGELQRA